MLWRPSQAVCSLCVCVCLAYKHLPMEQYLLTQISSFFNNKTYTEHRIYPVVNGIAYRQVESCIILIH